MSDVPISSELILQIEEQFAREERFLEQLQETLRAVSGTTEQTESSSPQRAVSIPIQQFQLILVEVESVHLSRQKLRNTVAEFIGCSPDEVRMDRLLDSSREQSSDGVATEVASCRTSIRHLRQKVNRTLGMLQAVVRSLFVERQLVELALSSLGAGVAQERYNASGERLLIHTDSPLETRA